MGKFQARPCLFSVEVHSDEPASGEMALALIDELDGDYGAEVLAVLDKHGIEYERVPDGGSISLQQYKGGEDGAELLDETAVSFPDGAYVMPMDQVGGTVLALLMEPDVLTVLAPIVRWSGPV